MRKPTRPWSLRRRLLAAILAASAVLWLAGLGTLTAIAWQETGEVFDHDGWRFEIVDLDGRKIDKLLVTRKARREKPAD